MEKTREELHREQSQREYLSNSKAILNFCLSKGMSEESALHFSTKSIDIKNFQWFYKTMKGNVKRLTFAIEKHMENVDNNRISSMWNATDPESEDQNGSD